jgi:hypothetical protein
MAEKDEQLSMKDEAEQKLSEHKHSGSLEVATP